MLISPLRGILKLGPCNLIESLTVIGSTGYVTWKASGEFKVVTIQSKFFKSNSWGNGSYNLTKIVGSSVFSLSYLILLAIIKLLSPKFK